MFPYRKYPRLSRHDYCCGDYFITVCTRGMRHYLGEIIDGRMHLTVIGEFLSESLENIQTHFPDVIIPLYVVMPNHFHAIVCIKDSQRDRELLNLGRLNQTARLATECGMNPLERTHHNARLSVMIGSLKSAVTRFAHKRNLDFRWQGRFHDHIIRNNVDGNHIAEYIINNVAAWDMDCFNNSNQ